MPSRTTDELTNFVTKLFHAAGVPPAHAQTTAALIVDAEAAGHSSHGLERIVQYINSLKCGELDPAAEPEVIEDNQTIVRIDGHRSLGHATAMFLTDILIERAKKQGVAVGTGMNVGHIGRLSPFCRRAADEQLISLLVANASGGLQVVAPFGGCDRRLSTNPIAIGIPGESQHIILDISTSSFSQGEARLLATSGVPAPSGYLVDHEGMPTVDASVLYNQPFGAILPFGGESGYKAFGLALAVEVAAGILSGAGYCGTNTHDRRGNGLFMTVINPMRFGDQGNFKQAVASLVHYMKSSRRLTGHTEVLIPGELSIRKRTTALESGVELHEDLIADLNAIAETVGCSIRL